MDVQQRTIAGRYELQTLIAAGGMGQVWRGRDALLERPVAVKVLRSEYTDDGTFLARFRGEAHHAARLAHRNIATVYDYGEVVDETGEHLAYLVMELVDGEPLSAVLAREGRLDADRTLHLLHQTAAALASAHTAGVVHRDVKPGNLLLDHDGVVKITDFGIAWSASDVPLTRTGEVVGTAHYLSPEQAAGGRAGPGSDVYALGMIGYECLAGRRAFDGDNAVQIALRQVADQPDPLPPDVPDGLRALVGRALAKDPALRFPDGAAFAAAAEDVRAGRPLPPPPPDTGTAPLWLLAGLPPVPAGHDGARPPRAGRLGGPFLGHGGRGRALTLLLALAAGAAIGIGALYLLGGPRTVPAGAATAADRSTGGAPTQAAGPAVTAPATQVPSTTVPSTTVPSTTEAPVTEAAASEPATASAAAEVADSAGPVQAAAGQPAPAAREPDGPRSGGPGSRRPAGAGDRDDAGSPGNSGRAHADHGHGKPYQDRGQDHGRERGRG